MKEAKSVAGWKECGEIYQEIKLRGILLIEYDYHLKSCFDWEEEA